MDEARLEGYLGALKGLGSILSDGGDEDEEGAAAAATVSVCVCVCVCLER